uniref:Uncharacterized protein n=1 Tax=Anguilla anguilla TaxID=7936 RepID=A0A0E9PGY7_ANGAN
MLTLGDKILEYCTYLGREETSALG